MQVYGLERFDTEHKLHTLGVQCTLLFSRAIPRVKVYAGFASCFGAAEQSRLAPGDTNVYRPAGEMPKRCMCTFKMPWKKSHCHISNALLADACLLSRGQYAPSRGALW